MIEHKTVEVKETSTEQHSTVANLRVRHQKIALCLLAGMTNKQAAEHVGVTPMTVMRLQEAPQFKAYMQALLSKAEHHSLSVRQQIADLVPIALEKMSQHISASDPKISLAASKDILDRAGYNKVDKSIGVTVDGETLLDAARLDEIQKEIKRLKDLGIVAAVGAKKVPSIGGSSPSPGVVYEVSAVEQKVAEV